VNPHYARHHPRWHRVRTPIFWWLGRLSYTRFILRELTSLFVAFAALLLLVQVWALGQGEGPYARFESWLGSPVALALHAVVLVVLLVHTVTWLNLAPKAIVVSLRGRRVPDSLVLAANYLAWLAASGAVAWALAGG
jgi:fumarate reductase subunit C